MNMGEKLQALRRSRGLSQEQLAETLGVSRQAISKWENGESTPDLDKLRAICTYFGVTTDYLIWERTEDAPGQNAGQSAPDAGNKAEHAARRESVRTAVREHGYWAGYVIAIIGGALMVRMLISLLTFYSFARDAVFDLADLPDMMRMPLRVMVPNLACYAAMLFGGLALGWWLKKRKRERETHDDL